MAIDAMTAEQPGSLPNPGDAANVALGAPPPLVEEGFVPVVEQNSAANPEAYGTVQVLDSELKGLVLAAPIDMMARATQEAETQAAHIRQAMPAKIPQLVSMAVCAKAARQLKAMSCSLVTQVSGYPEGCECRMKATTCPAVRRDLGFTGVSPSIPLTAPQLGGTSVVLCMYWQWSKPQDRSKEDAAAAQEVKELATSLVKAAHVHAAAGAMVAATAYYAVTPAPMIVSSIAPIPPTPAPIVQPLRVLSTTP